MSRAFELFAFASALCGILGFLGVKIALKSVRKNVKRGFEALREDDDAALKIEYDEDLKQFALYRGGHIIAHFDSYDDAVEAKRKEHQKVLAQFSHQ